METTAPPWDEGEQSFASDGGSGASDSTDATPATQTEAIDLATLRAKVAVYSTPENRPRIRNVLASFGAAKLTELREEQYAAVLKEVESVCRT